MGTSETVHKRISDLVTKSPVVLFMKGTRRAPQCGFSAQVVQILDELLPDYETVDVLASPEIRDGIKEFSQWPTIPQLYVGGNFVGGCDIVRDMNASGDLKKLFGADAGPSQTPTISVTEGALAAFEAAAADAPDEGLRLQISASFQYDLFFGPAEPGDVLVPAKTPPASRSLVIALDRASARRADGLAIDFVGGAQGGFKLANPNEPPKVKQVGALELRAMLDRKEVILFDVRPPQESAIASIADARPLDAAGLQYLRGLDHDTPIALHCHHGMRSQDAAQALIREGFRNVYNLRGGIAEWSDAVDPNVPRY